MTKHRGGVISRRTIDLTTPEKRSAEDATEVERVSDRETSDGNTINWQFMINSN